jgi:hypothetical protein
LKADRYAKDLFEKLRVSSSSVSSSSTSHNDDQVTYKHDDEYYLGKGSEPPRFAYYRLGRLQKMDQSEREACYGHPKTITQEELDYALRLKLRESPEQRYQDKKSNFLFHDLSCYMKGLGEEDHGCNGRSCIPECEYYPEHGRIEDEQIIKEHNEMVESYRQKNAIVPSPSPSELLKTICRCCSFSFLRERLTDSDLSFIAQLFDSEQIYK